MELTSHILQIRERLQVRQFANEAAVSQGVVLRLLAALGWPAYDTRIVSPEYSVQGRRVDFALCHPPLKPLVFIEVKQVGQSGGADKQLFEYAFLEGVPMAILTDGQEWNFYLPGEQGHYQERRVYKLDLLERTAAESAELLNRYLEYKASCTHDALHAARSDYKDIAREREISATLPAAWEKLIGEPDELLVELQGEKVESLCGFKPELALVVAFLQKPGAGNQAIANNTPIKIYEPALPKRQSSVTSSASPTAIGLYLNDTYYPARTARAVMISFFEEIPKTDPAFLEKFAASQKPSNKRRIISPTRYGLHPNPKLCEDSNKTHELSNGWFIWTQYSKHSIEQIVKKACEVAGLSFGSVVRVNLGEVLERSRKSTTNYANDYESLA